MVAARKIAEAKLVAERLDSKGMHHEAEVIRALCRSNASLLSLVSERAVELAALQSNLP